MFVVGGHKLVRLMGSTGPVTVRGELRDGSSCDEEHVGSRAVDREGSVVPAALWCGGHDLFVSLLSVHLFYRM